ncbi:MAG: carboxypeptidase-like regulatory domain-containing protein [Holophagae bacterium]|nr:carboxypeptidase-like regulatory domain-containing protein [Holophagae bacterium]
MGEDVRQPARRAGCRGSGTASAGILLGSVSDAATGRPIAGAVASLDRTGVWARTDADGIFKLPQVTGSYTLIVSADGYAPSVGLPVSMTMRANSHAGSSP